jgi:hypothetical protein
MIVGKNIQVLFFFFKKRRKILFKDFKNKRKERRKVIIYDTHRLANVKQRTRLESWKKIGDGNR